MATRVVRTPGTNAAAPEPNDEDSGAPAAAPAEPAAAVAAVLPVDDMPNAIDVDPEKIIGPVLTRQGWVVPKSKPGPGHVF